MNKKVDFLKLIGNFLEKYAGNRNLDLKSVLDLLSDDFLVNNTAFDLFEFL